MLERSGISGHSLAPIPSMTREVDPRITATLNTMAEHLRHPFTVAELAAAVRLSPSRFAHLFRAQTGLAPLQYLHVLRMAHARVLLERTSLTVKEVMAEVGMSDPSHFARAFRRFHGLSARELRNRHRPDAAGHPSRAPPRPGAQTGGSRIGQHKVRTCDNGAMRHPRAHLREWASPAGQQRRQGRAVAATARHARAALLFA